MPPLFHTSSFFISRPGESLDATRDVASAIFGAYILVGRALSPVDRITASAERITLENLANRLPVPATGDELERLSISLNRMIERINLGFQTDKRFVADASHELRTPVAIIRAELEALAGASGVNAPIRERVGSILEEVERLGRTVDALFAITRLDAGEAKNEWKEVELRLYPTKGRGAAFGSFFHFMQRSCNP